MKSVQTNVEPAPQHDLIWGAAIIGPEIGLSARQAFHLMERGLIPSKKVGGKWCASREALRRHFAMGEVA